MKPSDQSHLESMPTTQAPANMSSSAQEDVVSGKGGTIQAKQKSAVQPTSAIDMLTRKPVRCWRSILCHLLAFALDAGSRVLPFVWFLGTRRMNTLEIWVTTGVMISALAAMIAASTWLSMKAEDIERQPEGNA